MAKNDQAQDRSYWQRHTDHLQREPARAWQCDSVGQGGGGQDALAIALIHADCQQEEKTRFTRAVGIFNALVAARDGSINTADIADQ